MLKQTEVKGYAVELDENGQPIARETSLLGAKQKELLVCVGFGAAVGAIVASSLPAVTVKFGVTVGVAVGTAIGVL